MNATPKFNATFSNGIDHNLKSNKAPQSNEKLSINSYPLNRVNIPVFRNSPKNQAHPFNLDRLGEKRQHIINNSQAEKNKKEEKKQQIATLPKQIKQSPAIKIEEEIQSNKDESKKYEIYFGMSRDRLISKLQEEIQNEKEPNFFREEQIIDPRLEKIGFENDPLLVNLLQALNVLRMKKAIDRQSIDHQKERKQQSQRREIRPINQSKMDELNIKHEVGTNKTEPLPDAQKEKIKGDSLIQELKDQQMRLININNPYRQLTNQGDEQFERKKNRFEEQASIEPKKQSKANVYNEFQNKLMKKQNKQDFRYPFKKSERPKKEEENKKENRQILMLKKLEMEESSLSKLPEKRARRSKINEQFNVDKVINSMELIFNKQQLPTIESCSQINAFWVTKMKWVRLVKNQSYKILPKINSIGTLAIYGIVRIKFFYYLVTPTLFNNTLNSQILQFGQCNQQRLIYSQKLILKHIRSIYKSCHGLRDQEQTSFDCLNLDNIILDFQGNALIDLAGYRLIVSNQEKIKYFYYLAPEVLLENKRSEKNDVWSLGCIGLSLIMRKKIGIDTQVHPYNNEKQELQKAYNKQLVSQKFAKILKFKKEIQKQQKKPDPMRKSILVQKLEKIKNRNKNEESIMNESMQIRSHRVATSVMTNQSKYVSSKIKSKICINVSDHLYAFVEDCLEFEESKRCNWKELYARHRFILDQGE